MPIQINLLAEQQALEEARRKDPVKRSFWIGGAVICLVLLWSASLQFKVIHFNSELHTHDSRWREIEANFLQVSNNFRESGNLQRRLDSLRKLSTNRFLWAPVLNAFQFLPETDVRVVNFSGENVFSELKQEIIATNITVEVPEKAWWQFKTPPMTTNATDLARRSVAGITNRPDLLRYQDHLKISINTSTTLVQVVAKGAVIRPETVTEKITLSVGARDYANPAGTHMDRFFAGITNSPYFRTLLTRTNSSIQPESVQPKDDPSDLVNPGSLFMPFVVEAHLPERIRSNE